LTADELRELYRHHRWATGRLLEAAERLPAGELTRSPAPGAPSVRDLLVRLLWTDWVWVRRCFGLSPRIVFDADEYPDVPALRERWAAVHEEMVELLGPLDDDGAGRVVAYRDLRGNPRAETLGRILLHVAERGSFHRGGVAALLRGLGAAEPPPMDLLAFLRSVGTVADEGE
jgi:uncharacterized damage-inducible protein DinB